MDKKKRTASFDSETEKKKVAAHDLSTQEIPVGCKPAEYKRIGVDYPVDKDMTCFSVSCGRIRKLENFDQCPNLEEIRLITNNVTVMEGFESCTKIRHLELYENSISQIQNISHLKELECLDLSFNKIRKIENIENLVNIRKLYLSSNKIELIENIENLNAIEMLELGSNRIREIRQMENKPKLEKLYLGKNKISDMGLPNSLPALREISIQSNRLQKWNILLFQNAPNISELYLSNNQLPNPPEEICHLKYLEILDLGYNVVTSTEVISKLTQLKELWLNNNNIASADDIINLKGLANLETIYLEGNPIQDQLGPGYRTLIMNTLPNIKQIDAIIIDQASVSIKVNLDPQVKPIRKMS